VLRNKPEAVIEELISPHQNAFLKGRDASVIAHWWLTNWSRIL